MRTRGAVIREATGTCTVSADGSLFGASSPASSIPALLGLYRAGALRLDELITTRYSLDDIARGYADMHAGHTIRGVIDYGRA